MDEVESTIPSGSAGQPAIPWRRNLYAIALAQFLAIVGFSLRAPFLPFFVGDLGVTSAQDQALWSGVINAAGAGVMAISAPIWGVVADRRGRRPMLLRAMFASVATVGLMAFAVHPWHLLVLRLIEGSLSGTVTAATTLVATTSPKARLGYTLGIIQTAIFAGASLGPAGRRLPGVPDWSAGDVPRRQRLPGRRRPDRPLLRAGALRARGPGRRGCRC